MIMHFTKAQNGLQASYDLSTQTKDDHLTVNECPSSYVSRKLTCFLQVPVGEVLTLIFATCGGIDDPVFVCNNKWRVSNPRPTVVKVLLTALPFAENKNLSLALHRPKALRQCTQLWRDGRPFTTSKLYQKETRSLPLLSRKSCFKSYAFVVELLIFYLCQIYTKRLQTYQRSHCPHNCNLRNSCSPEREIPNLTGQ